MLRVSMQSDSLGLLSDVIRTTDRLAESMTKNCGHGLTEILEFDESADGHHDMLIMSRVEDCGMCGQRRVGTEE